MKKENLEKLKKVICEDYITAKKNLYTKICDKLESFHNKKEKMKLRGFNDFNFINLLVGFTDENSHSKIIAEFLNPYGSHYQGELFLEKFFEILNFKSKNLKEWEVYTEFFVENVTGKGQGRIDILLKNKKENKFIIIENKIYAGDQDAQIYKYVEDLYSKFEIKNADDILVLYLTPFEREISKESLGNYELKNEYLIDTSHNQQKALFKNITYNKEILEWIEKSLKEIENICSLKESLKQYQQAVKYITNKKGDIMNLEEYLKKLLEGNEEDREIIKTLVVDFEDFKKYADEKCLKVMEDENINSVLENIKLYLRQSLAYKLKKYIKNKFDTFIDGKFVPFGSKEKMSYILFTDKKLNFGYILFFENKNVETLKLGQLNCSICNSNKDINCVNNLFISNNNRWDVIKNKKCFEIYPTIANCYDNDFYENYILNPNQYLNEIISIIESKIE